MNLQVYNPNTPRLWDKRLFETNEELLKSPYYMDKINKVTSYLENKRGKFLDIGFGAGNLERSLFTDNTKLQIYGIDFSHKAVASAKKKFKGNFLVGRSQKLPFKKETFDFVAMLDVLEHISENESKTVLGEINRVLKRGGHFIISVPINENLKKMDRDGTNYNKHLRQYTPELLEKELNSSGFHILKKEFIYAFRKNYILKTAFVKLFSSFKKPNVLVVFSRKLSWIKDGT